MTEPLRLSFRVDCSAEHAFQIWTAKIAQWWPADHTVSGTAGLDVVLEPRRDRGRDHLSDEGDATTRVAIEHRGWERLGAAGPGWREANRAGWSSLLPHFIACCRT